MSLYLPPHSPERGFTRPEMLCWSVSIATTLSARRASTSATQAPSSRRAFTPGNDLTRSPWPLTSVQPRHCYPDLHHGNKKKYSLSFSSRTHKQMWTLWTFASQQRKTTLMWTFVSLCGSGDHRVLRRNRKNNKISVWVFNQCGEICWQVSWFEWAIFVEEMDFITAHQAALVQCGKRV